MNNNDIKIGIVVVGYNRIDCILRLLNRLNECDYPSDDIPLVISLDNCGNNEIYNCAKNFEWIHGKKTVILQKEHIGLRLHILKCGDYINQYKWDAAIILEDDVYTAVSFYNYAKQAVSYYQNDEYIAGISLYSLTQNQTVRFPFSATFSQYDAYFIQLAQSLGQVWTKKQWESFSGWYSKNSAPFFECQNVPFNVCRWPETSWLKYHIRYCIEENKYFVYPYQSLTTNFGEIGTHCSQKLLSLQAPLQNLAKDHYRFPKLFENGVIYDAWCENCELGSILGFDDICIDLYGAKENFANNRYWLTTLPKSYKIVQSFGMELRPIDMNIICKLPGNEIFLYDTMTSASAPTIDDRDISIWNYYNNMLYPDEAIKKIAKPMFREIRMNRIKLLWHPHKLIKKIISHLKKDFNNE